MIDGQRDILFKTNAIKLTGDLKNALHNLFHLEIRPKNFIIKIIELFFKFLGVISRIIIFQ